jgi:hypothetical protein
MTTNELNLARAFRDAGFEQDKAEAVAQTIFAAIRDNVATKSDVQLSAADLRQEIQAVRSDLQTLVADLRQEMQKLKFSLGASMVAGFVASFGLLFAALHLWPPHA